MTVGEVIDAEASEVKSLDTLTQEEETFCLEVAQGGNKTKAATVAFKYDNVNAARTRGYRLMQESRIQNRIIEIQCLLADSTGLSTQDIVQKLMLVYEAAFRAEKFKDANEAMKLIGEIHGAFHEKQRAPSTSKEQKKLDFSRYANVLQLPKPEEVSEDVK